MHVMKKKEICKIKPGIQQEIKILFHAPNFQLLKAGIQSL